MANRIVNTSWRAFGTKVLPLGERGENGVTQIVCDVSAPLEQHPYAAFSLIAGNANGDEYPVANAVLEGDNLVWTVSSADTAYAGSGWVQAVMFGPDGEIAKTAKAATLVNQSISSDEAAPEPVQEWIVEAQKALASIPQTVNIAVDAAVPAALQEAKESGEFDGPQGIQGEPGADGVSPIVEVEKNGNSTTLTIIDANGVKSAEILDGADGADGVSPVVEMSKSGGVTTLSVKDKNGTKTAEILDGPTGATGKTGPIGPAGADGKDGVSPSVSVSKDGGVTTIQIKDVYGVKTATINDGERGPQGEPGVDTSSNLVNGEAEGSLRTVKSPKETADYKLGKSAFAAGPYSKASGNFSHAFGYNNNASGYAAHATGQNTTASEMGAHAEGLDTTASGIDAHAEGYRTVAKGRHSHAEGFNTIAAGGYQHVQGQWNVEDTEGKYAHIVGWGSSEDFRRNIHTLDTNGNAWFDGDVECGMASGGENLRNAGVILHGTDFISRHLLSLDENGSLAITNLETGEKNPVGGSSGGTGGSLPTGGEPHQMLVTNADRETVWEDRTHYKIEGGVETLIPETSPTYSEEAEFFYLMGEQPFPTIGETYTILWNGVEYECEAVGLDDDGITAACFGNLGAMGMGDETSEPFVIMIVPPEALEFTGGIGAQIVALDGSTEVTFSIYRSATVYKKLDYEYMPKGYPAVKVTEGAILPETKIVEVGAFMGTTEPLAGDIVLGKMYTVNLNGTEVQTTAKLWNNQQLGANLTALGNIGLDGSGMDTGEEFVIVVATPEVQSLLGDATVIIQGGITIGSENYFSITGEMEKVTEMDGRFVKTAIANQTKNFVSVFNPLTAENGTMLFNMGTAENPIWVAASPFEILTEVYVLGSFNNGFITYTGGNYIAVEDAFEFTNSNSSISNLSAVRLRSPNGKMWRITVDDSGTLSATEVT